MAAGRGGFARLTMFSTPFLDIPPLAAAAGTVRLPGSKSISNRVLLLAALATGTTTVRDLLDSDDTRVMLDALAALGCGIDRSGNTLRIEGLGGKLRTPEASLFLGNAGTAMRPLTAALALLGGEFELRGVLPGSYDLMTVIPDGTGGPAMGRARVQVPIGGSVEDVTLDVKTGLQVKARLLLDSGAAPASLRLNLRSLEVYPAPFEAAATASTFDASGSFVFSNVAEGRYFLTATPMPANAYIADVQMGGRSVFDSGFAVDTLSGNLEVQIRSKGARIQGTVLDASQKPVPNSRVVLVPETARRQNQSLYKVAISDSKGSFNMTGVAPGEYKLFAWQSIPGTAYMSAEFLAPYEVMGQAVRIMEGASTNAVVKLIQ